MAMGKGNSGSKPRLTKKVTRRQTTTNGKTTVGPSYTQAFYGSAKSQKRRTGPVNLISKNGKNVLNPNSQRAETRSYIANWSGAEGPKKSQSAKKATKKATKKTTKKKK